MQSAYSHYELYSVIQTVVSPLAGMLIEASRIDRNDDTASVIFAYRPDRLKLICDTDTNFTLGRDFKYTDANSTFAAAMLSAAAASLFRDLI